MTQASLNSTADKAPPKAPPKTPAESAPNDKSQSDKSPSADGKVPSDTTRLPQFDRGMEFIPKSPNDKVAFSLEDADLSELLRVIGEITGRRFVVATNKIKSFKATVYSPQKITVTEAYQAFLSILQSNGLTTLPAGGFWKIVDTQDIAKQATPVARHGEATTSEERYVTRIHRLEHVNAEEVVSGVLSKFQTHDGTIVTYPPGNLIIMTDTGENIRRMSRILEDIDIGSATDKVWMEPLYYVPSAEIEKKLSDIFDMKKDAKDATKPSAVGDLRLSKLVPLERPNAIVIVGSETSYTRALEFIKRMDVQVTSDGDIHVVPLEHTDAKKIVVALNEAVQGASAAGGAAPSAGKVSAGPLAILDSPVKVSAEETTNSILVTSSEHDFAAIREVIAKLDKPRRQVYIEAVVMDVSVTKSNGFGVKWHGANATDSGSVVYGGVNALSSAGGVVAEGATSAGAANLQGLALGIAGPSVTALGMTIPAFGALIEAHAQSDDFDILQTPHILCTDNMPAEIHSQLNTSLQKNAASVGSTAATGPLAGLSLGAAPAASNYTKIGPKLKITPHLNASDEVRLDVEETISDLSGSVDPGTLGTISFLERAATTTLTVRDQQTVVIGGLVRDKVTHSVTKVPILGDLPLLGALFRQSSSSTEKSNLVLVLTPYIIREQDDLRRIYERKMQERQDFIDHTQLFGEHDYEPPKDYTRTRGLLEEVRQSVLHVNEMKRIAESNPPAQPKTHEPSAPLDLPAPSSTPPVTPPTPTSHAAQVPATPIRNANAGTGTPAPARTLDRVER